MHLRSVLGDLSSLWNIWEIWIQLYFQQWTKEQEPLLGNFRILLLFKFTSGRRIMKFVCLLNTIECNWFFVPMVLFSSASNRLFRFLLWWLAHLSGSTLAYVTAHTLIHEEAQSRDIIDAFRTWSSNRFVQCTLTVHDIVPKSLFVLVCVRAWVCLYIFTLLRCAVHFTNIRHLAVVAIFLW